MKGRSVSVQKLKDAKPEVNLDLNSLRQFNIDRFKLLNRKKRHSRENSCLQLSMPRKSRLKSRSNCVEKATNLTNPVINPNDRSNFLIYNSKKQNKNRVSDQDLLWFTENLRNSLDTPNIIISDWVADPLAALKIQRVKELRNSKRETLAQNSSLVTASTLNAVKQEESEVSCA